MPIIDEFFQLTGIRVIPTSVGVDAVQAELSLDVMAGKGEYDIALPATFDLPDLVDLKAIVPMTDFAQKYEPMGYRSNSLFSIGDSFDDEIYGFQTDGDAYVMFFNQDFLSDPKAQSDYLEQFGSPLRIPVTWAELDQQIGFFHRPEDNLFGATLFRTQGYVAWEYWVRLHAKGLWPFAPDMTPQITHADSIAALEEMIAVSQSLVPTVGTMDLFENWERFSQGNVYCNIGWGGSQKYFNRPGSKVKGKLAYAPTPGGYVNGELVRAPYFNWGWDYVVTASSTRQELAYLFCLFASTPEMSLRAVRAPDGFFDPFQPEHYKDQTVQEIYSKEFLDVHQTSMAGSIPDLYLKNQSDYFRVLGEQVFLAINGKVSAAEALKRVDRRWRLITGRAGAQSQIRRWNNLQLKYPQATKNHLRTL
ncbi:ABC transporter substrate-binding protein [Algirhabdus cladophorae]|uniref:ABC transporter substrate-binding protein n=1 Tax=Algirhabdus cladophorae TaxID=3377108 RepID=UPI003B84A672